MPSFQKLNSPIRFIAVKEGIRLNGSQDMQTKVMVTMFSLFADLMKNILLPVEMVFFLQFDPKICYHYGKFVSMITMNIMNYH
jgi:hypothetical protein